MFLELLPLKYTGEALLAARARANPRANPRVNLSEGVDMVVGDHSVFIDLELDPDTKDRRGCVRIAVRARVCLSHSTFGFINSHSRDISDSGVFVEIKDKPRLPVGAHIKMQMLDSAMPEIVFNVKMERSDEDGIGLSFVDYELNGQRFSMADLKQHSKFAE